MLESFVGALRDYPPLAFFLVLGSGYLLGRLPLGKSKLGAVTGTLVSGLLLGQLDLHVSDDIKQGCMLVFMFAIGFRMGPQFFRGLKSDGWQQAVVAAVVAVTGLGTAYAMSKLFGYDTGTAAGVLAGSMTASSAIGTASDALSRLPLPADEIAVLTSRVAVAYAVTYLFGVLGSSWFLAHLAPRLMRIDLAEECRRYERSLPSHGARAEIVRSDVDYRTYVVPPGSRLVGKRVRDLEALAAADRLVVERMRRGDRLFDPDETSEVAAGDVLAIAGRRERLVPSLSEKELGLREVDDRELLEIPGDAVDVVVTSAEVDGRTLAELAAEDAFRGAYLRRISRAGNPVAIGPETRIERGDVLALVGSARRVSQLVGRLGAADRPTDATDLAFVALAIVAGALLGMPSLRWGALEIGLGTSVGALLAGVVCGSLRATRPALVRHIPGAALWLFESAGLAGFVALVGLGVGPRFVSALEDNGVSLLVAGLAMTLVPHLLGVFFGRHVLRMHPGVLLGACAGGGTSAPALAAIQEKARSPVPALGYGVAYAVGSVLLALWGSVIVAIL